MQAPEVGMTSSERGLDRATYGGDMATPNQPRVQRQVDFSTLMSMFMELIPVPLRRSMTKINGFLLCILSLMGAISLSTWSISDPNRNFSYGGTVENWMGFWGASFADFSMQFLGFAAAALLVPPFIWGVLKLTNRPVGRLRPRLGFWVGSIILLASAMGCVAMPEGWPLPLGLGGVVGDAVLSIPMTFTGSYPGGIFATILFVLFAVPGVWMLIRACKVHGGISSNSADHEQFQAERNDGFAEHELASPNEVETRDWSGLIAAPIGLLMHWGYRVSLSFKNRQEQYRPAAGSVGVAPAHPPHAGMNAQPPMNPVMTAAPAEMAVAPAEMAAAPQAEIASHVEQVPVNAAPQPQTFVEPAPAPAPVPAPAPAPAPQQTEAVVSEPVPVAEQTADARVQVTAPGMGTDDNPVPHTDAADTHPVVARAPVKAPQKSPDGEFILPPLELLSEPPSQELCDSLSNEALEGNARELEGVLEDFGVKGQILKVRPGPVVTLYELEPAPGVKSARVIGLAEDIARSMSAISARVAVVAGRNAIGIELPNRTRETVYLREQLASKEFTSTKAKLPMCLGKTIGGEAVVADLAKMPHLLVAGTTGSGKSVAMNTIIMSLLYRFGPDQVKLIMIDPKMLELSIYEGIPHLLTPVVVDPKKAVVALKWTVREMEERYKKMSKVGVRNIDGFNARVAEAKAKGEVVTRTVQTGFDSHTGEAIYEHEELDLDTLPYIVVLIDEMADLMMVAGKDIEGTVQRLAQMARAAGIHVIMATQRPSTDVITGTIKANFPTRISFQVTSKIDSRVMLGEAGAEQLLGMGDMLYMAGGGRITRVHGPFVDDPEVEDIVNHLKAQGVPQYLEEVTEEEEEEEGAPGDDTAGGNVNSDDPYDQAVAIVLRDRKASTSYIQRRLSIGYNRAASLIERMEQEGLISAANHAGKREILVPAEDEMI